MKRKDVTADTVPDWLEKEFSDFCDPPAKYYHLWIHQTHCVADSVGKVLRRLRNDLQAQAVSLRGGLEDGLGGWIPSEHGSLPSR